MQDCLDQNTCSYGRICEVDLRIFDKLLQLFGYVDSVFICRRCSGLFVLTVAAKFRLIPLGSQRLSKGYVLTGINRFTPAATATSMNLYW